MVIVVTGVIGIGKTTVCRKLIAQKLGGLSLEEFFSGVKRTNHRNDELLTEIRFNEAQGKRCEFLKMGQRTPRC